MNRTTIKVLGLTEKFKIIDDLDLNQKEGK